MLVDVGRRLLVGEVPPRRGSPRSDRWVRIAGCGSPDRSVRRGSSSPRRCSSGTSTGRFIDFMKRRPSVRIWLRTAHRWYSSAQWAADGIWIAVRRCPMVSGKIFAGNPFMRLRGYGPAAQFLAVVLGQCSLGNHRHPVAQQGRGAGATLFSTPQGRCLQGRGWANSPTRSLSRRGSAARTSPSRPARRRRDRSGWQRCARVPDEAGGVTGQRPAVVPRGGLSLPPYPRRSMATTRTPTPAELVAP